MLPERSDPLAAPVGAARAALARLVADWRARYGDAVVDVAIDAPSADRLRAVGHVLVPSQRDALARVLAGAVAAAGAPPGALALEVHALTEADEAVGWVGPAGEAAAIRARPDLDADLSTEIARGDPPARVLAERGPWRAVELADRTVGWAEAAELNPADAPATVATWRAEWAGVARAAPPDAWPRAAGPWRGVPYRLGGNSRRGIDCSGLTQRLLREVAGVGLPKHSRDQARFGLRVARSELAAGDLLYLSHVEHGTAHVALVVEGPPELVAHASREHGVVVFEGLDDLLARYLLRAARRFPAGYAPASPR